MCFCAVVEVEAEAEEGGGNVPGRHNAECVLANDIEKLKGGRCRGIWSNEPTQGH